MSEPQKEIKDLRPVSAYHANGSVRNTRHANMCVCHTGHQQLQRLSARAALLSVCSALLLRMLMGILGTHLLAAKAKLEVRLMGSHPLLFHLGIASHHRQH